MLRLSQKRVNVFPGSRTFPSGISLSVASGKAEWRERHLIDNVSVKKNFCGQAGTHHLTAGSDECDASHTRRLVGNSLTADARRRLGARATGAHRHVGSDDVASIAARKPAPVGSEDQNGCERFVVGVRTSDLFDRVQRQVLLLPRTATRRDAAFDIARRIAGAAVHFGSF